uniref:hypothetical protein n=1 Tax=Streptosporangium sp. CA-235898 TaxID=3240073 RepID=UPI003F495262
MSAALNPDGTYSRDFLLWEARLAARVTGRDLTTATRRLRHLLNAPATVEIGMVLALADIRADTHPAVAAARTNHTSACEAYLAAMTDLADLDPAVDIRPLLADH